MSRFINMISAFSADRRGATAIEYGLIAALIAVAAIAGMNNFGKGLGVMWGNVSSAVKNNS